MEHFQELFSLRFMTMNVHQLVHLADIARSTGPLFSNDCVSVGRFKWIYCSTDSWDPGYIATQVVHTFNLIQAIAFLGQK